LAAAVVALVDSGALVAQVLAEAELPVLAHLVVDSALLLDLLRRQSYSAAMAGSTPSPGAATYEPVPRSR
jgi:hypothetical protein